MFLLKLDSWLTAAVVAMLAVLTFVPFKFIHPFRVARLRSVNIAMVMPQKLQPGPLAGEIAVFAPISLFFFIVVLLVIGCVAGALAFSLIVPRRGATVRRSDVKLMPDPSSRKDLERAAA